MRPRPAGPSLDDMRAHIERLVQEHDLTVTWCARPVQSNLRDCEEIIIAPVKSEISYAVALHEIGHIRGHHQRSRRLIVVERHAWAWAARNALEWTPRMERCRRESLEWYEDQLREGKISPINDHRSVPVQNDGSTMVL